MAGNKKQTTRSNYRLAVDVGNTHTVVGLFQNTNIKRHWRLATRKDTTNDEIAFWLRGLNTPDIAATALASVVPMQDNAWLSALGQTFGVTPRILDYRDCLKLKLRYEIPSQIGADRLANVLGAEALRIGRVVQAVDDLVVIAIAVLARREDPHALPAQVDHARARAQALTAPGADGREAAVLDDERAVKVPTIEEAKRQITQMLQGQAVQKMLADLRAKAKVD